MKNWVSWLMHNYRITFLIIILAFAGGIVAFEKMSKAEFPDFVVRQGLIIAVYPGATSEEVEEQVTKPIERFLFTFNEVYREKTISTSKNGLCVIQVELDESINRKDEVWSKVKHGINGFKGSLPKGVLAVIVKDDFGDTSALLLALESPHRSYRDLQKFSNDLADRLRAIPTVSNVRQYGESKEQITLYVDHERLAAYGIGQTQFFRALNAEGITTLSGSISGWEKNMPIHIKPSLNNEEELANLVIYTDERNNMIRVKDVARVVREYDNSESYIKNNNNPCVLLSLEMKAGNNIVQYGKDVQKVLDKFTEEELPEDVQISRVADQCKVVNESVNDFLMNLLEAMAIIIIVMVILFPLRTAIIAGITVPLSTFISVGVMYLAGIPLNIVTLAALIIVLGMVVDNSIVVIDGYMEYLNKGYSRWYAAAESARFYFMPMALATLCISIIFFPFIFIMEGMIGEMIQYLPWTMLINLIVSLVLAIGVIPMLEYLLIKVKKSDSSSKKKKISITDRVQTTYDKILSWTFKHPWLTIIGGIGCVVISLILVPQLKIRMLPIAERNQFAVEISLPDGKGMADTEKVADSVYHVLINDSRVKSITRFMGCSSPRFQASYAPQMASRNYAQFIVNTTSNSATIELLDEYEPKLSNIFPEAYVKIKQLDYQNYNTFEFRFYGDNLDSLHYVADQLMAEMRKIPKLTNIHTSFNTPRPLVEVDLDPVATSQLGINRTMAELELALATENVQVGQIWEGDYEVPVVMKDERKEEIECSGIGNTYMTSLQGLVSQSSPLKAVPLRQMATVTPSWSESSIAHRGGLRCISVIADPKRNVYPAPIQKEIVKIIEEKINIPVGVTTEYGGDIEEDAIKTPKIALSMIVSLIIIFFFLLFNFKQYKLTIICIVAISLCLPGAMTGLLLMNRTMGITAIFGFITLMGMIMRNEILIFEHARGMKRQGLTYKEAAFSAGQRRMVPIFLTTATTAVGVIPMIVAATNFWMPVGVIIFAGGIGALILVTIVLPVVYWKLNSGKK